MIATAERVCMICRRDITDLHPYCVVCSPGCYRERRRRMNAEALRQMRALERWPHEKEITAVRCQHCGGPVPRRACFCSEACRSAVRWRVTICLAQAMERRWPGSLSAFVEAWDRRQAGGKSRLP